MTPDEFIAAIEQAQQLTADQLREACLGEAMEYRCVCGRPHEGAVSGYIFVGDTPFGVCDRHTAPAVEAGYVRRFFDGGDR